MITSLSLPFEQLPCANFLVAFGASNMPGKVIILILAVGSIMAWTIMVTKARELSRAKKEGAEFIKAYRREGHPLALFLKRQKHDQTPSYSVYVKACNKLGGVLEARGIDTDDLFMGGVGMTLPRLSKLQVSEIRNVAECSMADEVLLLEDKMGLLATAVTAAPFLGLLGTVWGVMDAFGGMASAGSAQLSAVAPGISSALTTTVVGLIVALPSSIGYNLLSSRIRTLSVQVNNFVQEYVSDIERNFLDD